ncbi:MAG: hypothetical protein ACH6QR_00465 [Candidatus Carsonella ruddii]
MLIINLLLKIKKKYKFNIETSRKFLEINNWNYNKTINYINNIKKNFFFKNYKFYSIISINKNLKIYLIKILFNSELINNSIILKNFIKKLYFLDFNYKNLINKIIFLSLELKEEIYLNIFLIFLNKNILYYNHKNLFFCLIKFKKIIINLCYNIIFNETNFLKFNKCKKNLLKQKNIQTEKNILNSLDYNNIIYSILINKNGFYFFYE